MAGGTLHDFIRQPAFVTSGIGGAFPCVRALEIIRDVCKGMAYLHGKSPPTLHGDLTSSNILLSAEGIAKVSDFGISRVLGDDSSIRCSATNMGSGGGIGGGGDGRRSRPGNFIYAAPEILKVSFQCCATTLRSPLLAAARQ